MSNQAHRIPTIDVGTPSHQFQLQDSRGWEAFDVRYHGFKDIPAASDDYIISPEFTCVGHQWELQLYPGGHNTSDDGQVAVYLGNMSNESIKIQYGFNVINENRKGMSDFVSSKARLFGGAEERDSNSSGWGAKNFAKRSEIMKSLVKGALIIEVRIKQAPNTCSPLNPFVPENPLPRIIQNKFMDEESSDVVFEVSNETVTSSPKSTKTSTLFYAHCLILQDCAPILCELCKPRGDNTPVPISDVKLDIFRQVLYYAYGGKLSDEDLKTKGKDIIDAADRFGIAALKLEAEAALVTSTPITFDNAMENLLYADAKNCALLKEAVMDFLAENLDESRKKLSFENAPGYLMTDLMTAIVRGKKESTATSDATDLSTARVSTLRRMLHEEGLDVDGSRETMIALLEENSPN